MPAYSSSPHSAFGLKAICIFHGNPAHGKDSHQGAVLLFSAGSGKVLKGTKPGRNSDEITLFKSLGLAVENPLHDFLRLLWLCETER